MQPDDRSHRDRDTLKKTFCETRTRFRRFGVQESRHSEKRNSQKKVYLQNLYRSTRVLPTNSTVPGTRYRAAVLPPRPLDWSSGQASIFLTKAATM